MKTDAPPTALRPLQHRSQDFAWTASTMPETRYLLELGDDDRDEIRAAVARLDQAGRIAEPTSLTKADFSFGPLADKLQRGFDKVRNGPGFVVLRGLPAGGLTATQFDAAAWGIGLHFGHAISQNAQGGVLTHVIDASAIEATPRMYRSNLELRPHTDITGMLSLACWRQSPIGGASVLVSGITVHDEIARRAAHLLEPLYHGFHYHLTGEEEPGHSPATPFRVPTFAVVDGQLSVRYLRSNIAGGHRELGVPLTALEIEALNLFDEVSKSPAHRIAFYLQRGEMIVINNYTVMHARTTFTEHADPALRRCLTRLWLDAENFRTVPREYLFYTQGGQPTNGVPPQAGKKSSLDFKKLYRDDPVATGKAALELADSEIRGARS
jgi:TfdA family taurine catabolism dioxygenase TauD